MFQCLGYTELHIQGGWVCVWGVCVCCMHMSNGIELGCGYVLLFVVWDICVLAFLPLPVFNVT